MNLGTDFAARPVLSGALLSGRELLLESLARRLRTRKGALFYDPTYGSYLPDCLGESYQDGGAAVAAICELDLEEDPRVFEARVRVTALGLEGVALEARLVTEDGPIDLILSAEQAGGLIKLEIQEGAPYGLE
ncbi:hypothetical protein ACFP81_10740 [Deinococcus lacus]|uniref:IraD/Gp25-like domain-containing protein n=1 Tax=Deinococcus lacus TaxID=392561 RepID=A0ABW1YDK8_9DEIO